MFLQIVSDKSTLEPARISTKLGSNPAERSWRFESGQILPVPPQRWLPLDGLGVGVPWTLPDWWQLPCLLCEPALLNNDLEMLCHQGSACGSRERTLKSKCQCRVNEVCVL